MQNAALFQIEIYRLILKYRMILLDYFDTTIIVITLAKAMYPNCITIINPQHMRSEGYNGDLVSVCVFVCYPYFSKPSNNASYQRFQQL